MSESNLQVFVSMDHARSQSVARQSPNGDLPAIIAYAIAIPSAIALVISTYLAYATFTMSEVAGCGSGNIFDCGHVLHSKWSKTIGIPVSVFAIVTHIALITGLFFNLSDRFGAKVRSAAASIVFVAAIAASFAAIYFISLQVFVLEHLCSYCMAAHTCGLIVGSLALWKLPIASGNKRKLAGVSMAGIAIMAGIQIASEEPPTYKFETFAPVEDLRPEDEGETFGSPDGESSDVFSAPGDSDALNEADIFAAPVDEGASNSWAPGNSVEFSPSGVAMMQLMSGRGLALSNCSLLVISPTGQDAESTSTEPKQAQSKAGQLVPMIGGSVKLKSTDWPLVGDPNAKHIFVEMFDYTCEHCRATNAAIAIAKKNLGSDLAVLTLPVPMNKNCNPEINTASPAHAEACELSMLAIAVWRLDKEKFPEFHQWMFEGDAAPSYNDALAKAEALVGADSLKSELAKKVCSQYIARNVELYKRLGGGPIPKMVFKQTTIVGKFTSGESLTYLIKEYTAPQP